VFLLQKEKRRGRSKKRVRENGSRREGELNCGNQESPPAEAFRGRRGPSKYNLGVTVKGRKILQVGLLSGEEFGLSNRWRKEDKSRKTR